MERAAVAKEVSGQIQFRVLPGPETLCWERTAATATYPKRNIFSRTSQFSFLLWVHLASYNVLYMNAVEGVQSKGNFDP